ncbi:MAG: hypothetical protein IIB62_10020 [Proteobacteria bacterium]|nr:hypothetical protein [Pseudomonadota bacterium]
MENAVDDMLYYQWIVAALGVIVIYMLLGYGWVLWSKRRKAGTDRK